MISAHMDYVCIENNPSQQAVKRSSSSGLHWLVKLRNGVISARLQGGTEHVQNKQGAPGGI